MATTTTAAAITNKNVLKKKGSPAGTAPAGLPFCVWKDKTVK